VTGQQLTFDLPARPALGRDAFMVASSNALALARIEAWRDWPNRALVLAGPDGSGKSHLAAVWAASSGATLVAATDLAAADIATLAQAGALVVEDVDRMAGDDKAEAALFHLMNARAEAGTWLLLTGRAAPARWPVRLPDLLSRVQALDLAMLDEPDDALLSAMLVKMFADRQLAVTPDLVAYLVSRIERSAAAARATVVRLDHVALVKKRPLTRRLAAEVLDNAGADRT
jgi:chromosomal replication initiation ATPase DnaA